MGQTGQLATETWYCRPTAGHETHGQSVIVSVHDGKDIAIVYDGDTHGNLLAAAPALLRELKQAELVIRHAVQESTGRVKAELVGGWLYHANKIAGVIADAESR